MTDEQLYELERDIENANCLGSAVITIPTSDLLDLIAEVRRTLPGRASHKSVLDSSRDKTDVDRMAQTLTAAMHALRSYQHANSSPELAEKIADACEKELAARRATP